MFPLKNKKIGGYTFGQPTFYGTKHTGTDYEANYVSYKAPFSGNAISAFGVEGGWFWTLTRPNGDQLTARHLKVKGVTGQVIEGQNVATTGNTGKFTTKPHLHQEVKVKGKLIDPETYNWSSSESLTTTFMKITIVANKNSWTNLDAQLNQLKEWFKTYSSGRLEPVFDVVRTDFSDIPFEQLQGQPAQSVQVEWYRKNITPLGSGEFTLLLLNPEEWKANGSFGTMTWGEPNSPVRCEVSATENDYVVDAPVFVHRAYHEIAHGLFFLTGQSDRVHELLYQNPPKRKELLDLLDYPRLQAALITIKPNQMNQAKVVKSKTSNTVYICYPIPDMDYLNKKANLEGFQVPTAIPSTDTL